MSTIDTLQQSQREIVVDFPTSKVKEAIHIVFEKIPSKYKKREGDANDILGTYHFPVMNNLNPAIIDLTVSEISDNKTKIQASISNALGAKSSISILSGLLTDYLNILSKALVGEIESFEVVEKKSSNSGCLWIAIIIAVFVAVFVFM